jgi:predicted nuclease of predicted toxin-antitoxin system
MKLLMDENVPHGIRPLLMPMHDVYTVAYLGWSGIENGKLLALAATNEFDVVITTDRGIEYQQNQETLPCSVIVLEAATNSLEDLRPLIPQVLTALASIRPKSVTRIS